MKKIFKILLSPILGKTWNQKFFRLLHLLALKGMNFGGGSTVGESGENYVINYYITNNPPRELVVFDVGANFGDYTRSWLAALNKNQRSARVQMFEPSAALCQKLRQEFKPPAVTVNQLALGKEAGTMTLFSDHEGSGLASLLDRDLAHAGMALAAQEQVEVITLDAFCERQNIARIDFLKLDVEGFELNALLGAKKLIGARKIQNIQFEFGGTDIDARVFFKDFYSLLSHNYKISRILKNGLCEIKNYSELDEIFLTTNYLAELK